MMDEEKQLETEGSGTERPDMAQPMENEAMPGENSSDPGNQTLEFADIGIDDAPAGDGSVGAPSPDMQAELAGLAGQIDALKSQLEERNSQYMRIAADFDNFRKRTQKEKEDLEQQIKCSTIVELLPVVDNFERARSQIKPQTDAEMNIHKSYQSVYKQLVECLKRIGVSPMRSEGKEFDPNFHEAVMREATDAHAEGTVIEELVRGYVLGDRVLRHAMVKVAAAPEPVITSDEGQGDAES